MGTLLIDGMLGGTWRITRHDSRATLTVEPFTALAGTDGTAVLDEGAALLAFAAAGATGDIVVRAP
jgi:NADPH-dependent curcumin reductase CurA